MHRLLRRQIRKHFSNKEDIEKYKDFLDSVDNAYMSFDEDFKQLERTLEISSKESFKELSDFKYAMSKSSMVVITNAKGIIKYVNENFLEASGYQESEMLGKDIRSFNSSEHPLEFYDEMNHIILKGKVWRGEICDIRKDGSFYWTDTIIVPLINKANIPTKYITYKSNISLMKEAEKQMIEAKMQAEKALEIKSEFLSNMSHEIRTPMNAILGLTDFILRNDHDKETLENLKAIKHSGENLLVIINDILDFSKLEAGKVDIEEIDFNFQYQIKHIHKTLLYRAEEKGLFLKIDTSSIDFKYLKGDPFRINQILINLIGNAIKFTSKGGITLVVSVLKEEGNLVIVRFNVKDSGIGIPKDSINDIFKSFSQADSNITRTYGGTGLGLSISMELVRLMGGELAVKSEENVGSEFYFDLPLKKSDGKNIHEEKHTLVEHSLKGICALVCEDNLINQKVVAQLLKKWKCDFDLADNGQIGLELLKRKKYDIVLMDLQMPVKDGFEASKEIRQGNSVPHAKHIPIIALTADAFTSTKEKVMDTGINDFVSKPYNSKVLNNKIFDLVNPKS